jgi:hypothetical protein
MKLIALLAVTGLTTLGLLTSDPSFGGTKAEIDASANRAIARFYRPRIERFRRSV